MKMKNDPKKFVNQVEELYQVALNEAASLLKNNPTGSYIATLNGMTNWRQGIGATCP